MKMTFVTKTIFVEFEKKADIDGDTRRGKVSKRQTVLIL